MIAELLPGEALPRLVQKPNDRTYFCVISMPDGEDKKFSTRCTLRHSAEVFAILAQRRWDKMPRRPSPRCPHCKKKPQDLKAHFTKCKVLKMKGGAK